MIKERRSIKVLVVEDSPVVQEFLVHILSSDPEVQVVGTANNGEEAIEAVKAKTPHVVTMDIHMPKVDGFDATRKIMETYPTPIVVVSGSSTSDDVATTFRALEAGALAVVRRPMGIGHPEYESTTGELCKTVKLMSEVKVVRRWARPASRKEKRSPTNFIPGPSFQQEMQIASDVRVVAIGASTGGPLLFQTILSSLPHDYAVPVLVVQHMATGFLQGFVEWLSESSSLSIHIAAHGEKLLPGHVYVAPDGFHMGVEAPGRILLSKDDLENGLRPSVSFLFRSVANVYGKHAIGIILTGMGKDGAEELKLLKDNGALTIAQDKESSVVHGMPGEAIAQGAATYVLTPEKIIDALKSLVRKMSEGGSDEIS